MNKSLAVNGTHLSRVHAGGVHRHTEAVLAALEAGQVPFMVFTGNPEIQALYPNRVRRVPEALGAPGTRANLQRILWYQLRLPSYIRHERATLFYSPLAEGMLFPNVAQIVTIHDLLPLRFPEQSKRFHWYFRLIAPYMLRSSRAILVDSEATRHDIEHYYGSIKTPIHVVYLGYRDDIFQPSSLEEVNKLKQKYELKRYVLMVSELRPYKNVRRLIDAFALSDLIDAQLVIAGKVHHLDPDIMNYPEQIGIQHKVKFLGAKPPEELALLYSGATAFAFPSLYEGFGIPPVEAMACGCPVVASNVSCMPEVCGEAAHYFNPYDPQDIARAIVDVITKPELTQRLRQDGFQRAKRYTNTNTTEQILNICKAYL